MVVCPIFCPTFIRRKSEVLFDYAFTFSKEIKCILGSNCIIIISSLHIIIIESYTLDPEWAYSISNESYQMNLISYIKMCIDGIGIHI